ncbi:hypothetical protein PGB90_008807 [Kerria lacca]
MIDNIISAFTGLTIGSALTWILRQKVEKIIILYRHRYRHPLDDSLKMVLVARTDIDMKPGKLAAQCAHAAVANYVATKNYNSDIAELWLSTGQAKVVCKCNSEESLMKISKEVKKSNLLGTIIKDAGRTQLSPGTITVLGVGPASKKIIDEVTGHLKLY